MNEIKVLSLWQPWASLVAWGLKEYETRSWATSYKGHLTIAATKSQPICLDAQLTQIWHDSNRDPRLEPFLDARDLPQGVITSVSIGISCYPMLAAYPNKEGQIRLFEENQHKILIPAMTPLERAVGNWEENRFAFKLIGTSKTPPIPYRGSQGLRTLKDPAICDVLRQLMFPEKNSND